MWHMRDARGQWQREDDEGDGKGTILGVWREEPGKLY